LFAALALVEHDLNPHATSVRIEPRLGDGGGSEAVAWDGNAGGGLVLFSPLLEPYETILKEVPPSSST
jgi:hypothetical protein